MNWQATGDTITVTISNQNGTPVNDLFITDYSDTPALLIECRVDNSPVSVTTESIEGSVYSGKYTNRWVIGTVTQNVQLKYVGSSGNLSFSAAHPNGLFGVMSLSTIGPPQNVGWTQ